MLITMAGALVTVVLVLIISYRINHFLRSYHYDLCEVMRYGSADHTHHGHAQPHVYYICHQKLQLPHSYHHPHVSFLFSVIIFSAIIITNTTTTSTIITTPSLNLHRTPFAVKRLGIHLLLYLGAGLALPLYVLYATQEGVCEGFIALQRLQFVCILASLSFILRSVGLGRRQSRS
jgi:hypothetical protein